MQPAVLIRLRPLGPWRYGPGEGGRHSVDTLFRSDRLFSAVTLALAELGHLEPWLDATARSAEPAVRFGSLFPYQADSLFVTPPATVWPPGPGLVNSPSPVFLSKLRWADARFVPLSLIQSLLLGQPALADQWIVDSESACLLRRDRPSASPFRNTVRRRTVVDRISNASYIAETHACVEFEPSAGLWTALTFASDEARDRWSETLQGAFRLLSDTGLGAGRRIGWGQFSVGSWDLGAWPALLFPKLTRVGFEWQNADLSENGLFWLLSLYSPSLADRIDWNAGNYRLTVRGGLVEARQSPRQSKKIARLVAEGSVLSAAAEPVGSAVDVAPDGFIHPVYRSGFALAIRLPEIKPAPELPVIELPVEPPEQVLPQPQSPEVDPVAEIVALPEPPVETPPEPPGEPEEYEI